MNAVVSESAVGDSGSHDFLFTWKPKYWSPRKLFETFWSSGTAREKWACHAHKKINPGDHAYLLKQGKPIGIFGRGTIIGEPKKVRKPIPGEEPWKVWIGFEASRGDVLWNPEAQFLVDGSQLLRLPVLEKQWRIRGSGYTLDAKAARAIDSIIFDSILTGRGQTTLVDEVIQEVARRKKLIEQSIRPDQQLFSETIRRNYRDKCAVTGCVTRAALEAAHIGTRKGLDDNNPANGILLRSDLHALFDNFLITLSEDASRVEVSPKLTDPSYIFLKTATVARPNRGSPPSAENIRQHRNLFFERQRRHSGNSGKKIPAVRP